jgi:hypothetical protein
MFYLKVFLRITNKFNTKFIQFLLNFYAFKKRGNIVIYVCIYIYQKNHVDFKFIYLLIVL